MALESNAVSTASVARWTSAGLAASDAADRATAIDSTSSSTTTVGIPSAARSGMCSPSSSLTRCWDCPCSALISPCGSISIRRTRRPDTNGAICAGKARASVVFPVPGGP